MRWEWHVACISKAKNACKLLLDKPEVKRPHGRPMCGL